MKPILKLLFGVSLVLAVGCIPEASINPTPAPSPIKKQTQVQPAPGPTLKIPIAIYILDDGDGALSSARTPDQLADTFVLVNEIWAPAAIEFEVRGIHSVAVSNLILADIARGDFASFFRTIESQNIFPDPGLINGFYASDLGGPNGINPGGYRLFFVTDEPSVHDERVTAHEIGHILGLHHTLEEQDRLIYPGTNGMRLTEEEIIVARYVAQGLLDRVR